MPAAEGEGTAGVAACVRGECSAALPEAAEPLAASEDLLGGPAVKERRVMERGVCAGGCAEPEVVRTRKDWLAEGLCAGTRRGAAAVPAGLSPGRTRAGTESSTVVADDPVPLRPRRSAPPW
jgi:hypothetical protein